MKSVLVFYGDFANIVNEYMGPSIHQGSMVVPLKEITNELNEKIKLFNDSHEEAISQNELVKYCINNDLVFCENAILMLKHFYKLI